jgi:O-antigen/teichoic acid export membrane protein
VASAIANFLLVIIIAKVLGPRVKGETTMILTTVSFVVFFCSIIGGQSYVYLIPKLKFQNILIPSYLWSLIMCLLAYVLISFLKLSNSYFALLISIISLLTSIISVHATILLSAQRWRYYNFFQAFPIILTLLLTLFYIEILNVKTIEAYLYSIIISLVIGTLLSIVAVWKEILTIKLSGVFSETETIFKFGLGYQFLELLQLLNLRFYFYMLQYLQGNVDLGFFSVGISLFEFSWILARSSQSVLYSKFMNQFERVEKLEILNRFAKLAMLSSVLLTLFLFAMPDSFFTSLFGKAYSGINWSVKWFAPGVIAYNVYLVYQSYYLSEGRYGGLIFINIFSFALAVIAGYLFIPSKYFSGAAGAASLSSVVASLLLYLKFTFETKQSFWSIFPNKGDMLFINNFAKSILKRH